MKSAIRRHHRARLLKRRKRISWIKTIESFAGPEHIMRYIDTPHPCSCRGCGNQRLWEGPTIQERRQVAWIDGGK